MQQQKMQQMQAEEAKQAAAGTTAEPGGRYKPPPVAPNAYSYTAAMSALSDAGKWEDALKTFEQASRDPRLLTPRLPCLTPPLPRSSRRRPKCNSPRRW